MSCPGCYRALRGVKTRFCPACANLLFDGKTVSPILPFAATDSPNALREDLIRTIRRISISGVQYKVSMRLEMTTMALSAERGSHE